MKNKKDIAFPEENAERLLTLLMEFELYALAQLVRIVLNDEELQTVPEWLFQVTYGKATPIVKNCLMYP